MKHTFDSAPSAPPSSEQCWEAVLSALHMRMLKFHMSQRQHWLSHATMTRCMRQTRTDYEL
jgi:hypothetical protein